MTRLCVSFAVVVVCLCCATPATAQDTAPVGTLYIPAIALVEPVEFAPIIEVGGVRQHDITDAVCWLEQTAWINGQSRVVLAGHQAGVFSELHLLEPGDTVLLFDHHVIMVYEVVTMQIVTDFVQWIATTTDPRLTIITCWGEGRWLVVDCEVQHG